MINPFTCLPFGTRLTGMNGTGSYCDAVKKSLVSQKNDNEKCQNSYECASNYTAPTAFAVTTCRKSLLEREGCLSKFLASSGPYLESSFQWQNKAWTGFSR